MCTALILAPFPCQSYDLGYLRLEVAFSFAELVVSLLEVPLQGLDLLTETGDIVNPYLIFKTLDLCIGSLKSGVGRTQALIKALRPLLRSTELPFEIRDSRAVGRTQVGLSCVALSLHVLPLLFVLVHVTLKFWNCVVDGSSVL